jgi:hypothetical protein
MSCEKPGIPPPGFFLQLAMESTRPGNSGPRLAFLNITWGIAVLQGLSMLSGQRRPESGEMQLPLSTWVISVVTCIIVLLAVATALA